MQDIRDEQSWERAVTSGAHQAEPVEASEYLPNMPPAAPSGMASHHRTQHPQRSPHPRKVTDLCAHLTSNTQHVVSPPPRAAPAPVPEWEEWPETEVEGGAWPRLPTCPSPAMDRGYLHPSPIDLPNQFTSGASSQPDSVDSRSHPSYAADVELAGKLHCAEQLEAEGYVRLPSKGVEEGYHAGAHLLTQEERDQEVERGSALAGRHSSATSADAMRHMMESPTTGMPQPGAEQLPPKAALPGVLLPVVLWNKVTVV